jgi:hypothetical protein
LTRLAQRSSRVSKSIVGRLRRRSSALWTSLYWLLMVALMAACSSRAAGSADASGGSGTDGITTVRFIGILSPPPPVGGACTYTASLTSTGLSTGQIDLAFPDVETYTPEFLITSALPSSVAIQSATISLTRGGADAGASGIVEIFGELCSAGDQAACEASSSASTMPPSPLVTPLHANLAPSIASNPSFAAVAITLIDAPTVSLLRQYVGSYLKLHSAEGLPFELSLTAKVSLEVLPADGTPMQTEVRWFPLTVSYGGLVYNLQPCAGGSSCTFGSCLGPDDMGAPSSQACVLGQDTSIDATSSVVSIAACSG